MYTDNTYACMYMSVFRQRPGRALIFSGPEMKRLSVRGPRASSCKQGLLESTVEASTLGLHVCKLCLPWGPMYINRAYFGLFGAPGL